MGFTMSLAFVFRCFYSPFMSIRILEQFFTVRHGRQVWTGYKEQGGHGFSRLLRFEDAWRMAGLIIDQDEVRHRSGKTAPTVCCVARAPGFSMRFFLKFSTRGFCAFCRFLRQLTFVAAWFCDALCFSIYASHWP